MPVWIKENAAWLLMLGYVLLLPTKALFNVPLVLMGLLGGWLLWRRRAQLQGLPLGLVATMLLALWLPMLLSMVDAVDRAKALENVLPYPLYGLATVFALWVLRDSRQRRLLLDATVVIISLWCLDGLLQYLHGKDLLGFPYSRGRVNGVFWPRETLGHVLAIFAPFYFERLRQWARGRRWLWLLPAVYLVVVVLTNSRSSWVMFFLGMLLYGLYLLRSRIRVNWRRTLVGGGAAAAVLAALVAFNPSTHRYVDTTLGLFSGNFQRIDAATAYRVSIWKVGVKVYADHWINGVGIRGFHDVYMDYAAPDNFWRRRGVPPTHAHLQGLEIATDTGTLGLLGLLLFYVAFIRYAWPRSGRGRLTASAWAIPVLVAVSPLNTHVSFYGAYWSGVIWWSVCLALGMLSTATAQEDASSSA